MPRTLMAKPAARTCFVFALWGLAVLLGVAPVEAETVVLRNGQSLSVTGYEQNGDALVLHLAGGFVTLPAAEVERIEPQVDFAPNAAPATPPLEESIRETAERYRLDPDLLASVIAVESRFDPRAISPKNAQGLMQLMPATSRRMGVSDVFDARQNLDGGARFLRELLDRYKQDVRLALAAYNAGPAQVDRLHTVPYIPETRQYVYLVLRQWNARAKTRKAAGRSGTERGPGRSGEELIRPERAAGLSQSFGTPALQEPALQQAALP